MDRSCPFLLLVLSCYSVCVHSEELSLTPIELAPVPCNDKAVGKLSRLAMTYINEDRPDGYKFALNRVANVHLHAQVSTAARTECREPPVIVEFPDNREQMFLDPSAASARIIVMRPRVFNGINIHSEIK